MITDLLAQIATIHREVPEEQFDVDLAVETAIEGVDRKVTEEDREELEELLPEWLEDDENTEVGA